MEITVVLFVNESFNSQCLCLKYLLAFLTAALGSAEGNLGSCSGCAPGCDFDSLSLPSDQYDGDRASGELCLV